MATLIPALSTCLAKMTSGEKRLAHRLKDKLEDDYLCWYNVPVGPQHLYPDFVVLHPRRGVLILEVKDWKLESLQRVTKISVTLRTPDGPIEKTNPMEQARGYALAVVDTLGKDPALVHQAGNLYQGKLVCPWGYGVVFSQITRRTFEQTGLGAIFEPHRVICHDEMTESVDPEVFQERLWGMFDYAFDHVLTLPQIDRIRGHLFPELQINPTQLSFLDDPQPSRQGNSVLPSLMRVMDIQQEQLARSLGEGHRVIHGAAGSGKTMILGYRCMHLAGQYAKPILVLCFNVSLAAKLKQMILDRGLTGRVVIRHFHGWCADQLRLYDVSMSTQGENYYDAMVNTFAKMRPLERASIVELL